MVQNLIGRTLQGSAFADRTLQGSAFADRTMQGSAFADRTFLVLYNRIDNFLWFSIDRQNPSKFRIHRTEPFGFSTAHQTFCMVQYYMHRTICGSGLTARTLHSSVLLDRTFHSSALLHRTFHSSALLHKTFYGFPTTMQNFKWFRKCYRTKNSSADLLFFSE